MCSFSSLAYLLFIAPTAFNLFYSLVLNDILINGPYLFKGISCNMNNEIYLKYLGITTTWFFK